ncbi:MAG: dTDP-4-dehydrorhamnose 3,5-epimerase family protein [Pseudobdellovibrionaceae bacterium]
MNSLFKKTDIEGCFIFKSSLFQDQRGSFTKIYSSDIFKSLGLQMPVAEVFFSNSHKNVVRGMHFQTPPHDHAKIVSCISGRVLDVVLDLRKSSPSYGKSIGTEMTASNETTVYIPKGCAHGFYSYEDNSILCYMVETTHAKDFDKGILWDSFEFEWPSEQVILSPRDLQFPKFQDFVNPFN